MEIEADNCKIVKSVLHVGSASINFIPETKVTFHFQTKFRGDDDQIIDDSRKYKKPMQLILGRKFKLPVWESLIQAMALNEVSKFVVDKSLVEEYPVVAKVYRDDALGKPATRVHHCHASLVTAGLGYDDLNGLMKNPRDLEFIFEIIKVEYPGQYEQELWQIKDENKLELIPKLKEDGNKLYASKEYKKALEKYEMALMFIDQFQLREKPRDTEWNHYNEMKVPFLLNSAQCKLCLEEYYAAIEKCNAVLEIDKENIKALFRRGKAYIKVWNLEEAKRDLDKVLQLDSSQKNVVASAMADLRKAQNESIMAEKSMLGGNLF